MNGARDWDELTPPPHTRIERRRRTDVNAKDKDWITALHGGEHHESTSRSSNFR